MTFPDGDLPKPEHLAYSSLMAYAAIKFPGYMISRHHALIAKYLEAVERGEITRLMISMPPRHGKLCADSTDVPTPTGWKKHGDLKPGDMVFGINGKPVRVIAVSSPGIASVQMNFTNCASVKIHPNHEWTVYHHVIGQFRTIETKYFIENSKKTGHQIKLFSNGRYMFQMPLTEAVEYEEKKFLVSPYSLGAWLGDGTSTEGVLTISQPDEDILSAVGDEFPMGSRHIHKTTGVLSQYYYGLKESLRKIGVLDNKYIPEIYKTSSINQRLKLLAGLIDTDGHVEEKTGRVRIATCSKRLADDISEISMSLGWRACIYKQDPCLSTSGIQGKKLVYYVGFQPDRKIPTVLKRKQINRFALKRRFSIESVNLCKPEKGRCIQVDSPDGLYLITRHFIPTHNSLLASEFFPAWYLGRNPNRQIIAAAHTHERAGDTGRAVRNQLIDPIHNVIFPECLISPDSKAVNRFTTEQGGTMFSVGVGGAIVGRGANLFLIDDPIKSREEAESDLAQRRLRDWFMSVAYTRLMTPNAIVIIMTRWHFYDLCGWLLDEKAHEKWTVLDLPAVAETDNDLIGREAGEALWPDTYPIQRLEMIKKTIGTREWTSQYQQRPLPAEGGMVDINWFKRYSYRERVQFDAATYMKVDTRNTNWEVEQIVLSWDTAYKESELNDPSCCTVWAVGKNAFYLLFVYNRRLQYPELKKAAISLWEKQMRKYNLASGRVVTLIEDRASGQSLIQDLKASTIMPVIAIKADTNKQVRLAEVTSMIESGRVFLPEKAAWLVDYETQMCQFPYSRHDDMVDSTSQFLRWAGKPRPKKSAKKLYWK